ncbi:MAG: hypothetical protein J2P20_20325 [Pseudonocardia sp.]|nr:hypothetical protein [Pseudonocardia sp.]MBO0874375.1 hypothetical protein [Pseudonocardia sp.]
MSADGCPGHPRLADELRDLASDALRLVEPLVRRVREQRPDRDEPEPTSCTDCPVCAVITVLRGGRSELAVRLADQAAELLGALRSALDEGAGAPAGAESEPRQRPTRAPRVQRIAVCREDPRASSIGPPTRPC